jgi:hypothetical protein
MNRGLYGSAAVLIAAMGAIVIAAFTRAPVMAVIGAVAGIAAVPVFLRAFGGGTR